MFASPIDPFHNSALSAEQRRQRDMAAMDQQHWQQQLNHSPSHHHPQHHYHQQHQLQQEYDQRQQDPQLHSAGRRKRSLHFEPEFLEALDSSLHDSPVSDPSTLRPSKKARRHRHAENSSPPEPIRTKSVPSATPADLASIEHSVATGELGSRRSSVSSASSKSSSRSSLELASEGPSIIDLSSGEKLEPLHWGENDHKRRRDSVAESGSSAESLREVFDVQGDGSLRAVLDHAPSLPSPPKRHRVDEPIREGSLCLLDEVENEWVSSGTAYGSYSDDATQVMDQDEAMADDSESTEKKTTASSANSMALIRYEGPKSLFLADGVDSLIKYGWKEHPEAVALDSLQGHELVLYRRPAPTFLSTQETDDDAQESCTIIEEMDDDAHYGSTESSDDLMNALEEKIMDMDLD
ncbi:hypothetical protein BGZ72_004301 [Mortierella alpina]|nr:hypothetical protein BGZ72_004301 [Mortierella alpina]